MAKRKPTPPPTPFAGRLRALRTAAGLSQAQLAGRAGLSLGAVTHLEQGLRLPSWDTVCRLATALMVSTEAFRASPPPS